MPAVSVYIAKCQIKIKEKWHGSEMDTHSEIVSKKDKEHDMLEKQLQDEMTHSDGTTLTITDIRTLLTLNCDNMRIHIGDKRYRCIVSSKAFRLLSNMYEHGLEHTEHGYACTLCHKSFQTKLKQKVHMRIHTGKKPYSCILCSKAFPTPSKMQIHMRKHTGIKPYSCKVCLKAYSTNSNLNRHIMIHTGIKRQSCTVCIKPFDSTASLKRHMQIHTRDISITY